MSRRQPEKQLPFVELPSTLTQPFYEALLDDDVDSLKPLLQQTPQLVQTAYTEATYDEEIEASAVPLLGTEIGPLNPLQLACLMECGECALAVLGYCSAEEMRRRSISGNTALHYASFSGLELVVTGLLRMGMESYTKNKQGYIPIDCALDETTRRAFFTSADDEEEESGESANGSLAVLESAGESANAAAEHSSAQSPIPIPGLKVVPTIEVTRAASPSRSDSTSIIPLKMPLSPGIRRRTSAEATDASDEDSEDDFLKDLPNPETYRSRFAHIKDSFDDRAERQRSLARTDSIAEMHDFDPPFRPIAFDKDAAPDRSILRKETRKKDASIRFPTIYTFLDCARNLEMDFVRKCIVSGEVSANAQSLSGLAALHYVAEAGDIESATFLLDHGADVNIYDEDGWTPLHNASMMGHTDMCKFLLSRGANPDALNADEQTPADVSEDEALKAYLQSLVSIDSSSMSDLSATESDSDARLARKNRASARSTM